MSQNTKMGAEPLNPNAVQEDPELQNMRAALTAKETLPTGYIEVHLSTQGHMGAPEVFHIRNLNTEDLMKLGLSEKEDLPIKAIEMLQEIIWEKDVRVRDFHEKEVMELLLFIYEAFYTDDLNNLDWIYTEEDWEFLKTQLGGEDSDEYRSHQRAYNNKTIHPKFSINLKTGIHYHTINPNIKTSVRVNGRDGFTALFGFPRYGDVIDLKFFIEEKYREKDRQFESIANTLKRRQEAEDRLMKGENINLRGIPDVPKTEKDKFYEYQTEKSIYALQAIKAFHLLEMNYVDPSMPEKSFDVSKLPLEKRIELAKTPYIDYSTFDQVQKMFASLEFGIKEEVTVLDPVMNKLVERKYSFQLFDLLQAIRDQRPAEIVLSYE
jgi:hypothetical protein